ncbi:MAG: LacI family transcriptional regulator, partial [Spirochaetes bacterium]|nr:LacI family transcriptional regulator [Spirochaetota bacterium]
MINDKSKDNITIEDVAKYCGYSRATISRVINKEGNVKPLTIEKIESAIKELGYKPNANASALSGGRTKTIAVLLPEIWRPYYSTLLGGLEEVASEKNYYILVRTKDYKRAALDLLKENRIDGFIIRNMKDPTDDIELIRKLDKRNVPFILIGNPISGQNYPSIKIDNVGGAREMAHHFVKHNFKKILFISGPANNVDSNDRAYGFKLGLTEKGMDPGSVIHAEGDYFKKSGYEIAKTVFADNKVDAVFAANDRMALGVLLYTKENNIKVPEDVALA